MPCSLGRERKSVFYDQDHLLRDELSNFADLNALPGLVPRMHELQCLHRVGQVSAFTADTTCSPARSVLQQKRTRAPVSAKPLTTSKPMPALERAWTCKHCLQSPCIMSSKTTSKYELQDHFQV